MIISTFLAPRGGAAAARAPGAVPYGTPPAGGGSRGGLSAAAAGGGGDGGDAAVLGAPPEPAWALAAVPQ